MRKPRRIAKGLDMIALEKLQETSYKNNNKNPKTKTKAHTQGREVSLYNPHRIRKTSPYPWLSNKRKEQEWK